MAKKQTFEDKSKKHAAGGGISVKYVKTVKSDKGSYKFQEKFVRVEDVSKVTELK